LTAAQAITEAGEEVIEFCTSDSSSYLILGFFTEIHKDDTTKIELLFSQIDNLNQKRFVT
jgi:hypothetical protein